jgi:uncharacterized repeat protein (TIGR01451 family)
MSLRQAPSRRAFRSYLGTAAVAAAATLALAWTGAAHAQTPVADLDVYLEPSDEVIASGDDFFYLIDVYNDGPSAASNVTVELTLPTSVTYRSADAGCSRSGSVVSCTFASIPVFASVSAQIDVTAPATSSPTTVSATARVTAATPSDPDTADNQFTREVEVRADADLVMWLSAQDAGVGEDLRYTAVVESLGPKQANGVSTVVDFPAATVVRSVTPSAGTTCATTMPTGATRVTCSTPALAHDGLIDVEAVIAGRAVPGVVAATATVTASSPSDPSLDNNTDSAAAVVGNPPLADLAVTSFGDPHAALGREYVYRLEVENQGPQSASAVRVTHALPARITYARATTDRGSCSHSGGTVTCDLGALASGAIAQIEIVGAPNSTGAATSTTKVAATGLADPSDPDPDTNTRRTTTEILPAGSADLSLVKTAPEVAAVGSELAYTLDVHGFGPDATTATVVDTLPASVDYVRAPAGCAYEARPTHRVRCTGVSVPLNGAASLEVVVRPQTVGTVTNRATATPSGVDLDTRDNEGTAATEIVTAGSADLVVTALDALDPVALGEGLEYVLRVENRGPAAAAGVTLTDALPGSVTFVRATPSRGTCAPPAGSTLTCALGALQAGELASIVVLVTPNTVSTITTTASASASGGGDPQPANNTASQSTQVVPDIVDDVTFTGSTARAVDDPDTDETVVTMPHAARSDLRVEAAVRCPTASITPNPVTLFLLSQEHVMAPLGGGRYGVTVPAFAIVEGGIEITARCSTTTRRNDVGQLELYRPVGVVTDSVSGAAVAGADVKLFQVPGWRARTGPGDTGAGTCESNASKPAGASWAQLAPAGSGVAADAASGRLWPTVNPTQTNPQGRYGWDLPAGCWFVVVSRAGYEDLTSPVVGTPSAVSDLNLRLDPALANATRPLVTGTAREGETLTVATDGTWTGVPAPTSFTRRWQRCDAAGGSCADIAGAIGSTYVLGAADIEATVRAVVTATNARRSAEGASTTTTVVAALAPRSTSRPTISGPAWVGETLIASPGSWASSVPVSYAYAWRRCAPGCTDVAGATGSSYTPTAADVGATLSVVVTARSSGGTTAATSDPTPAVTTSAPSNVSRPAINGTPRSGETLVASPGSWASAVPVSYAYAWQRCAATCVPIAGATTQSYTAADEDVGSSLAVFVTATSVGGSSSSNSEPTPAVGALPPRNATRPAIAGTVRVGERLTATPGSWASPVPVSYAYAWQRCAPGGTSCQPIPGATGATYAAAPVDTGWALAVEVTATSSGGSTVASSDATAPVAPAPLTPPPPRDLTPPNTRITRAPARLARLARVSFRFVASEPGARFQCKLDRGRWTGCRSPKAYARLRPGKHTFQVRAIDAAGNVDPSPAKRTWRRR